MSVIKLMLITTLLSLIPGQLIRITLGNSSAVNITDILIAVTNIYFYIYAFTNKGKIIIPSFIMPFGLIFLIFATASTVLSLAKFTFVDVIAGSLFLVRLVLYTSLGIVLASTVKKEETNNYIDLFLIVGLVFAFLGIVQLFVFPDLTSLQAYGWDPHINRLVSSTLDPNYTGAILTVMAAISISRFLYKPNIKLAVLFLVFTVTLLLTFSRSTYFAYATGMLVISAIKSPKLILIPLIAFVLLFITIPTFQQRIIGAVTLDDTSRSRLQSWQNAFEIYKGQPFFGVGFNNYRIAQRQHGFFAPDNEGGHSGAGADSSILLVLATTGMFGIIFYIGWMLSFLKVAVKNLKTSFFALGITSSLAALSVHSQFVNSLFYPQILMPLIFLIGIKYVKDL